MHAPTPRPEVGTLCQLLRHRATTRPGDAAYVFPGGEDREEIVLTYGGLDRAARCIASELQRSAAPGERALLVFPHGPAYVEAFFGCLYAGIIAMPAYPPSPARPQRARLRLQGMLECATPSLVLGSADAVAGLRELFEGHAAWARTRVFSRFPSGDAPGFVPAEQPSDSIAFLQFTSGSTSAPKGVCVTHANLLHNSAQICSAFGHDEHTRIVSWLPLYHDMGLIGGMLQPLWLGATGVLMAPADFMQRPLRWLETIERYRATTSGGPNFAYDLCVRRSTPQQRATLDLSSWRLAFNGAEPVRSGTLDDFADAFAASGFDARAFYPCYGLAEATLFVTGGVAGRHPQRIHCDPARLERGRCDPAQGGDAKVLVSCGSARGQQLAIVEPERARVCEEGEAGEIWVSGPSVARGYWNADAAQDAVFDGRIAGRPERFLRTGDLGFVRDGQLYVTGRRKDLIIVRGRNIAPQDLEYAAERAHAAVHAGAVAAFAIDADGNEGVVVVAELDRRHRQGDLNAVGASIRAALVQEHEIAAHDVVLVGPGRIPKTSSGKLQRGLCRKQYLARSFEVLWSSRGNGRVPAEAAGRPLDLRTLLATIAQVDAAALDAARPVTELGLDSLGMMHFQAAIERHFARTVPLRVLFGGASLEQIAADWERWETCPVATPDPDDSTTGSAEIALGLGQRALWLEAMAAPRSDAYELAAALRLRGPGLDRVLRVALEHWIAAHALLRSWLVVEDGTPRQRIADDTVSPLRWHDTAPFDAQRMRDAAAEPGPGVEASRPLFAIDVFPCGADEAALLLRGHHMAVDMTSAAALLASLRRTLAACGSGTGAEDATPASAPNEVQRTDAAARERDWQYWSQTLAAPLPRLEPPVDRPRKVDTGRQAGRLPFCIDAARRARIERSARALGVTVQAWLLCAYQVLLHRWSAQDDLLVAVPTTRAGRRAAALPGYDVEPVALRSVGCGPLSFAAMAQRTAAALAAALDHRSVHYSELVQRFGTATDGGWPSLAQAWFSYHRMTQEPELPSLLLGCGGVFEAGGFEWSAVAVRPRDVATELTLVLSDSGSELQGIWEHSAGRIDAPAIERLAARFNRIVDAVLADPSQPVGHIVLLDAGERSQLLEMACGTPASVDGPSLGAAFDRCAHRHAGLTAVIDERGECTYAELQARVRRVATGLAARGLGTGDRVALAVAPGIELVSGILATLALGAVYVPLDPSHPPQRLRSLLADAAARWLVVDPDDERLRCLRDEAGCAVTTVAELASTRGPAPAMGAIAGPGHPAYLLFTSGSSGRPKGVLCPHAAVLNLLADIERRHPLPPGSRCSWWTSAGFDVSVYEMFSALLYGGTLCIVPDPVRLDGTALARWLGKASIASAYVPPFFLRELRDETRLGGVALQRLLVGVEPIDETLLCELRAQGGGPVVLNGYGPTEATVCATMYEIGSSPAHAVAPIGRPMAGVEVYVLDASGALAPRGTPGELHIGGQGLALGYWNQPAQTAARFVPHPFSSQPGARLYRSGDMVRWQGDGTLAFLGRADQQVKLRGQRIELGEIEAVLRSLPGVGDAAAVVSGEGSQRRLIVHACHDESVSPEELAGALRARLPAHMIPARIVSSAALPRLPSGKLDRAALAAAALPEAVGGTSAEAARGPMEARVAKIWGEVLGRSDIARNDHFFQLGGDSLQAARAMHRVSLALGASFGLAMLLQSPTVSALAAELERRLEDGDGAIPAPAPRDRTQALPVSSQQRRMWLLQRLDPGAWAYNANCVAELVGPLDHAAMERSLAALVARHEALRTQFEVVDGEPRQRILPPGPISLTAVPVAPEALDTHLRSLLQQPFDLERDPLLRTHLLRLSGQRHVLVLATHHAVFDGAHRTMLRDLAALYRTACTGGESGLPALAWQPADLVELQAQRSSGAQHARLLDYWRTALEGESPALALPTDRVRPPVASLRGALHRFAWPERLAAELAAFRKARGTTAFVTVLAAFQAVLSRLSGQSRIQVGTPVLESGLPQAGDLLGCLVNTVVLRADVSPGQTFAQLLAQAGDRVAGALQHQELAFDALVEALQPPRDPSRNPLFQAMFVLQPDPWARQFWESLEVAPVPVDGGSARFDLLLSVWESEKVLHGAIEYATDLFDASTIARLAEQLEVFLGAAIAQPDRAVGDLPLLAPEQLERQLYAWNERSPVTARDRLLHAAIEAQVRLRPQAPAVIDAHGLIDFATLDAAASRVARELRLVGVRPREPVALMMPRDARLVVAMLGILKAGASYVPLEPSWPAARAARVLEAIDGRWLLAAESSQDAALRAASALASVACLIVDREGRAIADRGAAPGVDSAEVPITGEDIAYTIFTSGSTGVPKGVVVQHGPAASVCDWINASFGVTAADRLLFVTSPAFDLSVYDVFGALGAGASVRIASEAELADPRALFRILAQEGITLWNSAPATLQQLEPMMSAGEDVASPATLRLVLLSGDWIPVTLPGAVQSAFASARVVALGGATEAAIWSNFHRVDEVPAEWTSIPYGRPIPNARYYILDARLQPQPIGVPGELYIGGHCLALGYAAMPAHTAERFLPDPFSRDAGARMYRTGDLARFESDGTMIFLGRADHQVKVRGYRIELGEIESVMLRDPDVAAAVAVAHGETSAERILVAYAAVATAADVDTVVARLRADLERQLPDYMLPAGIVPLETLPLTPNGKVDRKALPAFSAIADGERVAAEGAVERRLHTLWSQVLGHDGFGVTENFFEIGGHSLSAFRAVSRVREEFGVELPLRALFEAPTVRAFAARIAAAGDAAAPVSAASTQEPVASRDLADLLDRIENEPA